MPVKRIRLLLVTALASLGVAACAANEADPDYEYPAAHARNDVICKTVKRTGSHTRVQRCRTRWQIEQERRAALDEVGMLRTMGGRAPTPQPPPTPP